MGLLSKMKKRTKKSSQDAGASSDVADGTCKPSTPAVPSPTEENLDPVFTRGWLRSMPELMSFDFQTLAVATSHFSAGSQLGEGGFGGVYKAVLSDGRAVAVKRLDRRGMQGDQEFMTEVAALSSVRHRNIIRLVGVCIEAEHRMSVFELARRSLRDGLDGRSGPVLSWPERTRAALDVASGLAHLHEERTPAVAHCDVTTRNVLLLPGGAACLSDFGLATDLPGGQTDKAALSEVRGAFGYVAPEVCRSGAISAKSDVYSFGVLLLEVLTGLSPIDTSRAQGRRSLVEWLQPMLDDPEAVFGGVIQPQLGLGPGSAYLPQVAALCEVASACLQPDPKDRLYMSKVARHLAAVHEEAKHVPPSAGGRRRDCTATAASASYSGAAAPVHVNASAAPWSGPGAGVLVGRVPGHAPPKTLCSPTAGPAKASSGAMDPFDPMGMFNNPFNTTPTLAPGKRDAFPAESTLSELVVGTSVVPGSNQPSSSCSGDPFGEPVVHFSQEPLSGVSERQQFLQSCRQVSTSAAAAEPGSHSCQRHSFSARSEHTGSGSLSDVSYDRFCLVCMHAARTQRLGPCGHLATCSSCGNVLAAIRGPCPVCSMSVSKLIVGDPGSHANRRDDPAGHLWLTGCCAGECVEADKLPGQAPSMT